jgi:hypothetical protein
MSGWVGRSRKIRTEDAPDEVCGLAFELETELAARPAVGAVAADHIFGFDDFGPAFLLSAFRD